MSLLKLQFISLAVSVAIQNLAIFEIECVDHTITVEPVSLLILQEIIRSILEVSATDISGHFTLNDLIQSIG